MITGSESTAQQTYGAPGYIERASVNGVELEYKVAGTGEPVILIHGAVIADAFEPLLVEPALRDRYQIITYHRRGYAGSEPVNGPVSISEQAADACRLMRRLGISGRTSSAIPTVDRSRCSSLWMPRSLSSP